MEKLFHKARIRVFAKEGEDYEKIRHALVSLLPFDVSSEKVDVEQHTSLGFNDKEIRTYEICISKARHLKAFFESLKEKLGSQKDILARQKETRLDGGLNFFIRLDKQSILDSGRLVLTDSGSCFHISLSIAAFPSRRETALSIIDKIFK